MGQDIPESAAGLGETAMDAARMAVVGFQGFAGAFSGLLFGILRGWNYPENASISAWSSRDIKEDGRKRNSDRLQI